MRTSVYNKVDISMEKNHATIRTEAKNGKVSTKITDLGSVLRIFKDQSEMDSGDLPLVGDNAIGVRRIYQRGNRGFLLINGVNLVRDINYGYHGRSGDTRTFGGIHLPGMLLAVKYEMNQGKLKIRGSHMFSHKDFLLTDKDLLYIPPFGNVYGNNSCSICWGTAGFKQLDNPGQAIGMMEGFLFSHFNNDLYQSSWANSSEFPNGNLEDLLRGIHEWQETNPRFPYEHIKMRKYGTYAELISYLQNNL